MSTMSTNVSANGAFALTDSKGGGLINFSPSFASTSQTTGKVLQGGKILVDTAATTIDLTTTNNRVYFFVKNADTDYTVTITINSNVVGHIKAGECAFLPVDKSSGAIQLTAATSPQKCEYLVLDALDA